MTEKELFARAVEQAGSCVHAVKEEQLSNALRELLNHMVAELRWVPDLLRGHTTEEVGTRHAGDVLHSDWRAAWQHAADTALVAVKQVTDDAVAHLSSGDVPVLSYIAEVAGNTLMHGWDVSRSLNYSLVFDNEAAQKVYDNLLSKQHEQAVAVDQNAPLQIRLLGLTGRQADEVQ